MRMVCISGSPRENGNTAALIDTMLDVFQESGWETERFHLNNMDFKGCQGCMTCKNKTDYCIQKDDMTGVYDSIQASQVVLLASPVYLWDVTGQFKMFLDRCFAFWDRIYTPRVLPGKTVLFVIPQGQENIKLGRNVADRYATFLKSWGFAEVYDLVLPMLNSRKDIAKHPEYRDRARIMAEKAVWGYARQ